MLVGFGEYVAQIADYQTLKIFHLLGVILFIGNIIITGWWKVMADRTGDLAIVAFAQRQVTLTDWVFTFGGVLIVALCGYGMAAHMGEGAFELTWIRWGYGLFIASGIVWVTILLPLQIMQARMARRFVDEGEIPARYWKLARRWLFWGIVATILPLANLYWMVMKI